MNTPKTYIFSIPLRQFAQILNENGLKIGPNQLLSHLRKKGLLDFRKDWRNLPTNKAIDLELFEIKKKEFKDYYGRTLQNRTVLLTPQGQEYLLNEFLGANA